MGCISSVETIKCPKCQTKNELKLQSFDSDAAAIQHCTVLESCKQCGQGLASEGMVLWSKPTPESFETEMVIELTDATLKEFVPSNPYDAPCKGFKLFFKVSDQTHGLWLPKRNLVEGTRLYVAVEKPAAKGPASVAEAVGGALITAVLSPEDLIPIPKSVERGLDSLTGAARLEKICKDFETKGGEWMGYEEEQKHKTARVMRWDPPQQGSAANA